MREKRSDIQGLRAVAVGLVVLFHAGVPGFSGGYVGVDVFFVISGFLISTHLLEGLQNTGGIGFAAFYARRARRLLPAAFTVVLTTVVLASLVVSPLQFRSVVTDAIATTLYVPNVLFAFQATDYLSDKTPSLFLHFWSLGVEEQFYLLWPLVLLVLFRAFASTWRTAATITALVTASFALCLWLTGFSQPSAFYLLPARIWEFGLGTLVALALLHRPRLVPGTVAPILGWAGLGAVAASGVLMSPATAFPGWAAAVPVVGTATVIAAGPVRRGPVSLLGTRPFTWLGDISYSLYLVHWPALILPESTFGYMAPLPLWGKVLIAAGCLPAAWLLYRYVEIPGQRIHRWSDRPRSTARAAAAGMAVIAVVAVGAGMVSANVPRNIDKRADTVALLSNPAGTPYVPTNLRPSLENVPDDLPELYANGCHQSQNSTDAVGCLIGANPNAPLVELFGDSHAAQWYPPLAVLAARGTIRLQTHTKSACPAARMNNETDECSLWADRVAATLDAHPPDLILMGNYSRYYVRFSDAPALEWSRALRAGIDAMPRVPVAVLADTPSIGVEPRICLGQFLDDAARCALARDEAIRRDLQLAERRATARRTATYIDHTNLLCNAQTCPSIIGDILTYRDATHLTATFAVQFADTLQRDISAALTRPEHGRGPAIPNEIAAIRTFHK